MKKTNFILSLLLGLFVTTFALTACSSDDDENNDNPLVGTWIVKNVDEDSDISFTQITLKSDGSGEVVREYDKDGDDEGDYYVGWTASGNTLRIDLGQRGPDDSLVGTYTLNGKTLTYSFHWKDYDGKWESDTNYTMTLIKQ